jgi:hypothetical protein
MARGKSVKLLAGLPVKSEASIGYDPNYFEKIDRRTVVGRAVTTRELAIIQDCGGADSLSYARRSLIRRAVWLEALVESFEQRIGMGEQFDLGSYTQALNSLLGLFRLLGLERRQKPVRSLREVMGAAA